MPFHPELHAIPLKREPKNIPRNSQAVQMSEFIFTKSKGQGNSEALLPALNTLVGDRPSPPTPSKHNGVPVAVQQQLNAIDPIHPPLCDMPSGCCSFTGPWLVTRSSLRMLRRVAAFRRPLRPVLLLVSFPRSRSPVFGVLGLCSMWHGVPFARQRHPIVGVLRMCWLLPPPRPRGVHVATRVRAHWRYLKPCFGLMRHVASSTSLTLEENH